MFMTPRTACRRYGGAPSGWPPSGMIAEGNRTVREVGGLRTVVVDEGYEVRGGVGCGLGGGPLWDLLFGGSLARSLSLVLGMGVLLGDLAV